MPRDVFEQNESSGGTVSWTTDLAGSPGATYTHDCADQGLVQIELTLTVNLDLTLSNIPTSGFMALVEVTQDATGSRTFSVNGSSVTVASAALATSVVQVASPDGTDLYVSVVGAAAPAVAPDLWLPTGYFSENAPRVLANANSGALSSGRLTLAGGAILEAGVPVNHLSFWSAATAAVTPTNQWACLVDTNFNVLAKSVDKTTEAWAANAEKVFDFAAPYTPSSRMPVYYGLVVVAATVPSISGFANSASGAVQKAPALCVFGNTGLTTPASLGATVTPAGGNDRVMYAIAS